MTLGPKAEAALKDGPQRVLEDLGKYRIYVQETVQDFARRVAMIAVEEGRERCAKLAESPRHFSCCHDGCRLAAALRAVFLAGARAQREMEPTPEMIQAWHDRMIEGADYIDRNSIEYALYVESYHAMQRAAPLVGGEE